MWDETSTGRAARGRSSTVKQQTAKPGVLPSRRAGDRNGRPRRGRHGGYAGEFKFKREPVASNFANIGVGVSALLPNRWQPFVNFRTIQGNENLVSYGGTAGLRVGL
jgi:hypothetical protein